MIQFGIADISFEHDTYISVYSSQDEDSRMASRWSTTIIVDTGEALDFSSIQSTQDAAHYLLDNWQGERSSMYCAAIRLCAKAIRGEVTHEAAYISFMAAVREANVSIVSNRSVDVDDHLTLEIQRSVAEDILVERRAL